MDGGAFAKIKIYRVEIDMAVTSLYSGENSIRNQRETSRNSLEKKYVFFTLGCLCFSAGLGIEFPGIYIYGNLGFIDFLILPITVLIIKNKEKFSWVSFFPFAIGVVAFFSFSYHVLVSDYYMVGFDGLGVVLRWIYYALVTSIFAIYVKTYEQVIYCIRLLWLGGLTLICYAWINWYGSQQWYFGFPVLSWIQNLNPNTLGYYFSLMVPMSIFLLMSRSISRPIMLIVFALLYFCILMTLSKSAVLISGGVLVISFIRNRRAISISLIAIGSVLYLYGDLFTGRWNASQASNADRLNLIESGFTMASENPLIGVGPKGFSHYLDYLRTSDAHNTYVNIIAELGFIAFILYTLMFVYLIISLFRKKPFIDNTLFVLFFTSILTLLLNGFVTGLPYSDKIPWILIGLLMACVNSSRYNKQKKQMSVLFK